MPNVAFTRCKCPTGEKKLWPCRIEKCERMYTEPYREAQNGSRFHSSTRLHDRLPLSRVYILLEAHKLAIPKAQNVTHLSIQALAGSLVRAGVAAFHHDVFAGVVERAHGDGETLPLRT